MTAENSADGVRTMFRAVGIPKREDVDKFLAETGAELVSATKISPGGPGRGFENDGGEGVLFILEGGDPSSLTAARTILGPTRAYFGSNITEMYSEVSTEE
jgi:hypothetical protein